MHSKTNNLDFILILLVDITKKNIILLFLNNFNINSKIASDKFIFDSKYKNFLKKILIFFDKFRKKKFFFEKKDK